MGMVLAEFTEKLVSVSDFSQGKAGKIFSDVAENNKEYIVMKNNQPTAILISPKEYMDFQKKAAQLDRILEMAENIHLLRLAENRDTSKAVSFESFAAKEGFSMEELEELSESVEIE